MATLTDDPDFGTKERVLTQGIHLWNMKALSLTIKKLLPMLKFLQTNRQKKRLDNNYIPRIKIMINDEME